MFDRIKPEEKAKLNIYVLIFYCLLIVGIINYYCWFLFKPNVLGVTLTISLSFTFGYFIHNLIKKLKK